MRHTADSGNEPRQMKTPEKIRRPYRKPAVETRGRIEPSLLGSPPPPP